MTTFKIAIIVGSNRRESLNRKLAHALVKLAGERLAFTFVRIDNLLLYNQDLEGELPESVVRFKAEIEAADGLLFVMPEHNRSLPAVLKNASTGEHVSMVKIPGPEKQRRSPEHRLGQSARLWDNNTCGKFWAT
jgi:NADPH-dependent FMN reductase